MVAENAGAPGAASATDPAAPIQASPVQASPNSAGLEAEGSAVEPRLPWEPRVPLGARPARNAMIGAALVGYAWLLAGTAPFSTKALLGVLLPGAVLGAIAYGRPPERIPPPDAIDVTGFSYWLICVALLFEWEASAVRDNSPPSHPSLTDLINPLIDPHPIKAAAIVVWLLAGWALVRR
jgi:hypothetical protein